jgi:hypothetical protein
MQKAIAIFLILLSVVFLINPSIYGKKGWGSYSITKVTLSPRHFRIYTRVIAIVVIVACLILLFD